jgi:hypothetical protein
VVVKVFSRAFPSFLKSALLCLRGNVAVMSFWLVESPVMLAHLPVAVAHEVTGGSLVAAAKTFAVWFTKIEGEAGMTVLIAVVHIGPAAVVEVLSRSVDAILKAPALNLIPLAWRRIPRVATLRGIGTLPLRHSGGLNDNCARGSQEKDKHGHY